MVRYSHTALTDRRLSVPLLIAKAEIAKLKEEISGTPSAKDAQASTATPAQLQEAQATVAALRIQNQVPP